MRFSPTLRGEQANRRRLRLMRLLAQAGTLTVGMAAMAAPLQPAVRDVTERAIRFTPRSLAVKVGGVVRYSNRDRVTHNLMVTGADDIPQDQGLQPPGAVVAHKFTRAGVFEVRCAIHPKMKMTVSVTP